jgi:hypothetical protein
MANNTHYNQPTAGGTVRTEGNKSAIRRFVDEGINAGNLDQADQFVTADCVERQHLPGVAGRHGIAVAKAFLSMMRGTSPDYCFAYDGHRLAVLSSEGG